MTPRVVSPGCSIPAVTTRLLKMKALMRNGRKTGVPVSGCKVASQTFFALQSEGVMEGSAPCLYAESNDCDAVSVDDEVKSVLDEWSASGSGGTRVRVVYRGSQRSALCLTRPQ